MVEPDHIVLADLRAIRGEMAKFGGEMVSVRTEMASMRHHMLGVLTSIEQIHGGVASMKIRLDHIEKRLELTDA